MKATERIYLVIFGRQSNQASSVGMVGLRQLVEVNVEGVQLDLSRFFRSILTLATKSITEAANSCLPRIAID